MKFNPLNKAFDESGKPTPAVNKFLDQVVRMQRPLVINALKKEREQHPNESPQQIAKRMEKTYQRAVTLGGGAVGATAILPGIGTIASLGLSSVAIVGYLEATALYAQAVAELHGVYPEDEQQNRDMVMALMLGEDGNQLMSQILANSSRPGGVTNKWGLMMGKDNSSKRFDASRTIRNMFVKRFLARQGGALMGRALPFGIGAVVGGGANLALSRQVVKAAEEAFGPYPTEFPAGLSVGGRADSFGTTNASGRRSLRK